nr:SemiSWEET transporter [Nitrospirota bacterium]
MDTIMLLGLAAGTLTTVAFYPQLIKTWKTKSARDMSFGMLATFCIGVFLWLVYGLLIHSIPVIVANVVTLVLAGAILALKIKYG